MYKHEWQIVVRDAQCGVAWRGQTPSIQPTIQPSIYPINCGGHVQFLAVAGLLATQGQEVAVRLRNLVQQPHVPARIIQLVLLLGSLNVFVTSPVCLFKSSDGWVVDGCMHGQRREERQRTHARTHALLNMYVSCSSMPRVHDSRTWLLTHSITHSLTRSLAHSLTHPASSWGYWWRFRWTNNARHSCSSPEETASRSAFSQLPMRSEACRT